MRLVWALVRRLVLSTIIGLPALVAHAQSGTAVWVSATAEDIVGGRLVYSLKEAVRRSVGLRLVDRREDAAIIVHLVTLDPDSNVGNRTIYSAVWTVQTLHNPPVTMYMTQYVGLCGAKRLEGCAQSLVATTDNVASTLRGWLQNILNPKAPTN